MRVRGQQTDWLATALLLLCSSEAVAAQQRSTLPKYVLSKQVRCVTTNPHSTWVRPNPAPISQQVAARV
jgi:hypothetical protein